MLHKLQLSIQSAQIYVLNVGYFDVGYWPGIISFPIGHATRHAVLSLFK